jgi:RNA polymerase sigma-70 factor (ECF subfamily)
MRPAPDDLTALLASARTGNPHAINALFEAVRPCLRGWAADQVPDHLRAKFDPSDLVQEALHRAVTDFGAFRGGTWGEFLAWLRSLQRCEVLDLRDYFATAKRDPRRERPLADSQPPATDASPSQVAMASEEKQRRFRAFQQLSDDDRRIIELRDEQGMPFREIATLLKCSEKTVRRLHAQAFIRWLEATEGNQ